MQKKDGKLHLEHRLRLKKRFLKEGLKNFELHNILELLLFFGVPQGDTNETAHRLLNKFGSLNAVFNAPYNELLEVDGVGDHTATLLKLVPQLLSVCLKEKAENSNKKSFTVEEVANYLIPLYVMCETEVVRALYFDNKMNLVENIIIFEGDVNSANLSYKDIVKYALNHNVPNVIVSHNHPNGTPMPSLEDIHTTAELDKCLNTFGINLVEHLLISGDKYTKLLDFANNMRDD